MTDTQHATQNAAPPAITDAQLEQILRIVHRRLDDVVREAVREVTGYERHVAQAKRIEQRIRTTLEAAPTMQDRFPEYAHILAMRAMPKSMLRGRIGNGVKGFDQVLASMVSNGQLLSKHIPGPRRRAVEVFGLP